MKFNILFIIFLSAVCSSCEAQVRKFYQDRLLNHLSLLKTYQGTMTETGILNNGEKLTSEITFAQPFFYFVKTIAPSQFQGIVLSYSGTRLVLYYPQTKYAIEFINLKSLSGPERRQVIQNQFNSNLDNYIYEFGSSQKIAGLSAINMSFVTKNKTSTLKSGESKIYDDFSFPLATKMVFRSGQTYSYQYDKISFNNKIDSDFFEFHIPKDSIVSRWDINSKNISFEEMTKEANFKFHLPENLPRQLKLTKIIRQEGPVIAFTAIYENSPYFFYLTVFKDYGFSLVPPGRGIELKDKRKGSLIPAAHSLTYSFSTAGAQHIAFGNLPLDEFLRAIDNI